MRIEKPPATKQFSHSLACLKSVPAEVPTKQEGLLLAVSLEKLQSPGFDSNVLSAISNSFLSRFVLVMSQVLRYLILFFCVTPITQSNCETRREIQSAVRHRALTFFYSEQQLTQITESGRSGLIFRLVQ